MHGYHNRTENPNKTSTQTPEGVYQEKNPNQAKSSPAYSTNQFTSKNSCNTLHLQTLQAK